MADEPTSEIAENKTNCAQNNPEVAPPIAIAGGNQDGQQNPQYANAHPRRQKHDCFDWVNLFVLVMTFFAAGGAAFEAKRLADGTDILIGDASKTAERQLRAYLGVSTKAGLIVNNDGTTFEIENFGQTPAADVKVLSSWEFTVFKVDLPNDFAFPEKDSCEGKGIRPGIAITFPKNPGLIARKHCTDELSLQQAAQGQLSAFFYGRIEYSDIFKRTRKTTFCLLYSPAGSIFCNRHNEIDPDEK